MIDPLLYVGLETDDWSLDIDIINGQVVLVPEPKDRTSAEQRKAVLAYQAVNTIPGDWDRGVQWGAILNSPSVSLADAMMEVQLALTADEGTSADNTYTVPIISQNEQGTLIQLLTVDPSDLSNVDFS